MKKIAVFVLVTLILALMLNVAYDKHEIVSYDTYVVSDGDTLWGIAEMSNGYNDMDINEIIYDIKKASNLEVSSLNIGDVVQIPIYEED